MTELRLGKHSIKPDVPVVEIWEDGEMIATIYPKDGGVRVVSKHLHMKNLDWIISVESDFPPALGIRIRE